EFFAEFEDLAGNVSRHYDFAATGLPVMISDLSTVDVPIDVSGLLGNITDLDVTLDIAHTSVVDLTLQLISPTGTIVTLFSNIDGTADNLFGTILDDEAPTSIDTGSAPFTGRFQLEPSALLSAFDGEDPNGQWILRVMDGIGEDEGMVNDIHLCIETDGGLAVEIDTLEPNTPLLDLVETSDTGRNNDDNVTKDNTPDVTLTTTDPNSSLHTLFTDNLKFRLYDRFEGSQEFLLYDSALDSAVDAVMTANDGFTALQLILETLPEQFFALVGTNSAVLAGGVLADGQHELKLEVEDRAGNISHDFLFTLTIDTTPPPVAFGLKAVTNDGLKAGSDSGVPTTANTLVDRVTNVTNPIFWGRAEANSEVRLYLDVNGDGAVGAADIYLGEGTAIPLDGDDAAPEGYWEIMSVVGLNDPSVLAALGLANRDGLRQILVTSEDLAGAVNLPNDEDECDPQQVLRIFIDTQGPQIVDPDGVGPQHAIEIGGAPGYNILAPILGQGPTPVVKSLIINIEDLPARFAEFVYEALDQGVASDTGHYSLIGDRSGIISIDGLVVKNLDRVPGQPARATIELKFDRPLPEDRYTLTLFDEIVDPAGNGLDGESRASSPTGDLLVRSGDGIPGGDFVARFTVDSRVEIASVGQAVAQVDINGNFVFDPSTGDFVNRDQTYQFGLPTDAVFAGQFSPPGVPSDGYDRLGAYGFVNGAFRWLLDFNNDGVADYSANSNFQINGLPFAGDFVGDMGDEIGLFDGTTWYIDANGDNNIGPAGVGDVVFSGNMRGLPITGDFDGDTHTDLATFVASTNTFFFDLTSANDGTPGVIDGNFDATINYGFGGVLERPFAGDFNLDGVTDIGLTVPSQNQLTPTVSDWYIILSNPAAALVPGTVNQLSSGFFPVPGEDSFTHFGSNSAVPLVGNFRAPAPQFANTMPGAGVVGADAGGGPHVRVFNNDTGELKFSFFAYDPTFTGGVRVASGDVTGDGVADIVTAPGPGGGPHIKVFDGNTGLLIREFMAFDAGFTGGVYVATGNIDGDSQADIIVGADAGGGPNVKVFSGADNSLLRDFFAFGASFTGGVRVASGNVDGLGTDDIIAGAGPGGGPNVKVFSGTDNSLLSDFMAFD
ncbi:MAG: proprotein convertase P-domain-containing protein, partial [Planctomycetaceae bacterium]|nr:proprotein convertase P-domain-containing protein [Planctomycetaceae bacterium]